MELLEILYLVLIIFTTIIGILLSITLFKLIKVLNAIGEIVDIYNKIKSIIQIYENIPSFMIIKVKEFIGKIFK